MAPHKFSEIVLLVHPFFANTLDWFTPPSKKVQARETKRWLGIYSRMVRELRDKPEALLLMYYPRETPVRPFRKLEEFAVHTLGRERVKAGQRIDANTLQPLLAGRVRLTAWGEYRNICVQSTAASLRLNLLRMGIRVEAVSNSLSRTLGALPRREWQLQVPREIRSMKALRTLDLAGQGLQPRLRRKLQQLFKRRKKRDNRRRKRAFRK